MEFRVLYNLVQLMNFLLWFGLKKWPQRYRMLIDASTAPQLYGTVIEWNLMRFSKSRNGYGFCSDSEVNFPDDRQNGF